MKRICSIGLMTIFSIALLQACNNNARNSKEAADSLNDATTTMPSEPANTEDATDFMEQAAVINMLEIQTGQLAQQKSSSQRIKDFAQMLIDDHTSANADLKALANSKSVALPDSLGQNHQNDLNDLRQKNATEFNEAFIDMMVKGHKDAVDLYEKASNQLDNQDVLAYVNKTLPVIQKHLDSAQAIQEDMGNNNNNNM